jgi:hypothetical protein
MCSIEPMPIGVRCNADMDATLSKLEIHSTRYLLVLGGICEYYSEAETVCIVCNQSC